jgi:hypothetical protein
MVRRSIEDTGQMSQIQHLVVYHVFVPGFGTLRGVQSVTSLGFKTPSFGFRLPK